LNIDFGINNERQDYKIGTVCGGRLLAGAGRVNGGEESERIWLMCFIETHI
jgi:hypothetical protein